jgi:membrane protease YdiL (CAAX protease family)
MNKLKSFLANRPVLSAIIITLVWFVVIMLFTGMATSLLRKDFGDPVTTFIGHLAGITFALMFLWRLGWSKSAGVAQWGKYQVWLISFAGTLYFALASLYSLYGNLRFNITNLTDFSSSGNLIIASVANCMSEEILFRGIFLYILIRKWADTRKGLFRSVIVSSGFFALFHLLHVAFYGQSLTSNLLLVFEAFIISTWWAAMVLKGGSIWPAFLAHFVVNTVVALQVISQNLDQSDFQIYLKLLLFSLPLGLLGIWMILKMHYQKRIKRD